MYCKIPLQSTVFHQNEPLPSSPMAHQPRKADSTSSWVPARVHLPHICYVYPQERVPASPCDWREGTASRLPIVHVLHAQVELLSNAFALRCCTSVCSPPWQTQQPSQRISFLSLLPPSSHIKQTCITQLGNCCFYPPGEELKSLVCIHFWMVFSEKIQFSSYSTE